MAYSYILIILDQTVPTVIESYSKVTMKISLNIVPPQGIIVQGQLQASETEQVLSVPPIMSSFPLPENTLDPPLSLPMWEAG